MMIRPAFFIFIITLALSACSMPSTPANDPSVLKSNQEMTGLLNTFKDALEARDFETLENLLADDFRYQEPGTPALSKAQLLEREKRGASGGPVSEIEYSVLSVSEAGDILSSDVELKFETRLPKGEDIILFTGVISQTVTAARTNNGLLFKSVEVKDQQLFRNGEPAGAEAIEEMHAGDGAT